MKRETLDTISGIFALTLLVFLAYFSLNLGEMDIFGGDSYQIYAEFSSVSGLHKGATVDIAGVDVGKVDDITLDPESNMARIRMEIKYGVKIKEDAIAAIRNEGIIGGKFIYISPGGSDRLIPTGGEIGNTKSPIDFEQLISQSIQGKL